VSAQLAFRVDQSNWIRIRDANPTARGLFVRHYSYRPYADGRRPLKFVGPGEYIALVTPEADALFVWRKFISGDGQQGVNCSVFRNESRFLSSDLITEASCIAWEKWPGERLYTYVNPRKIQSTNPGYCFLMAGWRRCGITKVNKLVILEKIA
jgi:hypothetical protein